MFQGEYGAGEHGGTHIDAPSHMINGGDDIWDVHEIPADHLIGPAVVIDISERAAQDPDAELMPEDLMAWEERHGRIPDGAIVFLFCN